MIETQSAADNYRAQLRNFEQGSDNGHSWFLPVRQAAMARFGTLGLPTTAHEQWRYTNVAALSKTAFMLSDGDDGVERQDLAAYVLDGTCGRLVLVNGRFDVRLSQVGALPKGAVVCSLAMAVESHRELVEEHLARHAEYDDDAFTALNTALLSDGAFIYLPRGTILEKPLQVLMVAAPGAEPLMAHPRHVIILEETSQATIIETYASVHDGAYFTNAVTEVFVGEQAVLDHYKIGRESTAAHHIGNLWIEQRRHSTVTAHTFTLGGRLVRNDLNVILGGEGCNCTLNGLTVLRGEQHADNHLRVEHVKPQCMSWEYFKGVYDDRSRGVFSGLIHVHENAQKTDAKQTSMSLLLSNEALADTKPQLEIFADDVKCTHGATIGQVDDNAIFYLRSRGLDAQAARSMLIYAFAGEVLSGVRFEPLRRQLQDDVLTRLPQGALLREAT